MLHDQFGNLRHKYALDSRNLVNNYELYIGSSCWYIRVSVWDPVINLHVDNELYWEMNALMVSQHASVPSAIGFIWTYPPLSCALFCWVKPIWLEGSLSNNSYCVLLSALQIIPEEYSVSIRVFASDRIATV